jgi:hypothetical protein
MIYKYNINKRKKKGKNSRMAVIPRSLPFLVGGDIKYHVFCFSSVVIRKC